MTGNEYVLRPIGIVRSSIALTAELVIETRYADGLHGLAERVGGHRKVVVLCWLHQADRSRLTVHPGNDEHRPVRGVFATRSPHRPNPVSLHTVELLEVRENVLRVRGMDAIDGTPIIDIKPFAPELDG